MNRHVVGRRKELAPPVQGSKRFVVVKVDDGIVNVRLALGSIVSSIVEFLQVGIIYVARDVFTVETTGIKRLDVGGLLRVTSIKSSRV